MPAVRVEFFGIPRERAGVARARLEAADCGELMRKLAGAFPEFGRDCIDGDQLRPEYLLNLNGRRFTRAADQLADDDVVLILSADAGG